MRTKSKLVMGFGINDADYIVVVNRKGEPRWICPYYSAWGSMLTRCYGKSLHKRRPTYVGCSVAEVWRSFMKFRSWMMQQEWLGKDLDKDLLVYGNKVYSPETCCFISRQVNLFIVEPISSALPTGVWYNNKVKSGKKYYACVRTLDSRTNHLGSYVTPDDAHQAWRQAKYDLAVELSNMQADKRVADALIERYQIS